MAVPTRSLTSALAGIAGSTAVTDDADACGQMAIDGCVPRWVVRPSSTEQVSAVVALAHDEALTVVPFGSRSALERGRPPARVDVALDLRALDAIVDHVPEDLTVSVQAGVTAARLAARLSAHRQFLPLDPPGGGARTLGGITATNASGPLRGRYGTMRDLLLGVRFVQADGTSTWGGARVVKSVTGYDVPKLMVGALGTLGVVCEMTLRLHPVPEAESTWLAVVPDAEAAQGLVTELLDSTLQPNRVEILNGAALDACGVGRGGVAIAVSIGSVVAAVRAQGTAFGDMARRARGECREASRQFWPRYDTATVPRADSVTLEVTTLVSSLADTLGAIDRAVDAGGTRAAAAVTGCAPVAALRVVLTGLGDADAVRVVKTLRDFVTPVGGHVVIARASRGVRAAIDPWGPVDEGAFELMRALKDELDRRRVLNPGRFVGGL